MNINDLNSNQRDVLYEILEDIEFFMDDIYPDKDFLIPVSEDILEFLEGFANLYKGEFLDEGIYDES